jgi:hypothetical protein
MARIIGYVSSLVAIWMHRNGLADLVATYSDFMLVFKQAFEARCEVHDSSSTAPRSPETV